MAEKDKVIKSGQLTLPRLLFLGIIGGSIVATVALGGIWLTIGYWLLTLAICGLLVLIALDYGVNMDRVDLTGHSTQTAPASIESVTPTQTPRTTMGEARPKRRTSKPARRRR